MILDHSVVQVTPAFNFCPVQLAANVFWISLLFGILHQREDKGREAGFARSPEEAGVRES